MAQVGAVQDSHSTFDGGAHGPPFSSARSTANARRFTQQAASLATVPRSLARRQEAGAGASQASTSTSASQVDVATSSATDPIEAVIRYRLQQAREGADAAVMLASPDGPEPGYGPEQTRSVPPDVDLSPGVGLWLQPSIHLRDAPSIRALSEPALFDPALESLLGPEPAPLLAPADASDSVDGTPGPSPVVNPTPPLYAEGPGDGDSVAPNDVQQRDIGNCYLMAAIMAVAGQDPEAIRRLITDNGDGTFDVRLFSPRYSEWVTYRVTQAELQETTGGTPDLRRAGTGDGELWVRVIEAAYAQHLRALNNGPLNGTELMNRGGYANIAMAALTGRPAAYYTGNLQAAIVDSVQAGRLVVVSTANAWSDVKDPNGDNLGPMRLAARHAYQALDVYQDPNNGKWILVLANPWGHTHPFQPGLPIGHVYLEDALDQGLIIGVSVGYGTPSPPPRYHHPARQHDS